MKDWPLFSDTKQPIGYFIRIESSLETVIQVHRWSLDTPGMECDRRFSI